MNRVITDNVQTLFVGSSVRFHRLLSKFLLMNIDEPVACRTELVCIHMICSAYGPHFHLLFYVMSVTKRYRYVELLGRWNRE